MNAPGARMADRVRGGSRANRVLLWLAVAAGVLGLALANAHLLHVAVSSQPDCVQHLKQRGVGGDGAYRAAKPAC